MDLHEFRLEYNGKDIVALHELFTRFLIKEYANGRKVVLIVDEAQNLGRVRLEELRVLSNINADKHLLLRTILVGQPELRALIGMPQLLPLAQRIDADCHIGACRRSRPAITSITGCAWLAGA